MYWTKISVFVIYVCLFGGIVTSASKTSSIILPPIPLGPEAPICTSYSGLCHLAYNLTDMGSYQVWNSEQQICRCPDGLSCNTDWYNPRNSLKRVFRSAGQEVEVKMSYCNLRQPDNVCRQNERAVVTRGRGPFLFEIAEDYRCRCYRHLYADRSWKDGDYHYIEYSCGKPYCGMNHLPSSECTRITYNGNEDNLIHEYLCRCPRYEECTEGPLPTADNPVVIRSCQRVPSYERRRRRRRQPKKQN